NVSRMEEDRAARFGIGAHENIKFVFGADIDTPGGVEQKQNAALREQPFGKRDLLLIASGKGFDWRPESAAIDFDAAERAGDRALLASALHKAKTAEALDNRQRSIVLAVELDEQSLGLAVLRQETHADVRAERIRRRGDRHRAPVDENLAGMDIGHAETGEKKVELPHALQAGDAKDFATPEREG